ncbi:sigma non-opioid intracellular receptor 1-like isoform X2 [Dreissena polymorpha]|uniref:sigma non-opioid intracellular receptor 1-like isoform X2 n=1 Tax=Dreissena polymorpha TaxID=45954 RepID=UPI002264ACE7|nr:sigma non-opioid intracellular receptor 1-like isoform X2 [Dreissena polymorpha]
MLCMIIKTVLIWLLALYVFFVGIQFWMQNKNYNFSAKMVEEIALKHKDKELAKAFDDIYKEFSTRFAGHILPESDRKWLFMNAGGWMGGIQIMHASITEYLLFFGTGVNTSGNSGRYWANISDTILTGSFRQWKEGGFHSEVFGPGETVHHYWGEVSAVQWDAGTWMVDYSYPASAWPNTGVSTLRRVHRQI